MEKVKKILIPVISALLAAVLTFCVTCAVFAKKFGGTTAAENTDYDAAKLSEIQGLIDKYFIGDVDPDIMSDALAAGMIEGLGDRWSYYISAEDYDAYVESVENAYVGIGVTISLVNEADKGFTVTDVTPDSPAYEAGIVVGDMITGVEGESTVELGMTETKNRVRGEEGTDVRLTILHDGEEKELTITRKTVKTVNVTSEMMDGDIAYIKIRNFEKNCADDTIKCIEDVQAQGARGIVFDVRFNPGGLKSELVTLLDYILPEGPLFRSESYDGREDVDYSDAACIDLPMMVLVNGDSYSAAEFFAAALQEYGVAKVVGTQTCGKGYYQTCMQLSDGSAINISIGKYFTPNGVSLVDVGITPDEVMELSDEDYANLYYGKIPLEDDVQAQKAADLLRQ